MPEVSRQEHTAETDRKEANAITVPPFENSS